MAASLSLMRPACVRFGPPIWLLYPASTDRH